MIVMVVYVTSSFWFALQFFISALSFATFAVSPELPQNRLQLSFTLLLTSVTFKFVINQSLPKISYLTYMVSDMCIILFYILSQRKRFKARDNIFYMRSALLINLNNFLFFLFFKDLRRI